MCGRYASFLPAEFIARLFAAVNPLPNLAPTWNMAPTMDAPVVRLIDGDRHLDALKWGLVPYFTKDLKKARKPINARSETIAKSGMFKTAFAERRCLVPAPAYYEWRDDPDGKTPFAVARIDGEPVAFGGIWERWKSPEGEMLQTFATITTDANQQLAAIQDRMPVIIEREDWPLWLGETEGDPALPAPPGTRGCPADLAGRESGGEGQERRARAARAINCYGTDVTLMRSSRFAPELPAILCPDDFKGAKQCQTTRFP